MQDERITFDQAWDVQMARSASRAGPPGNVSIGCHTVDCKPGFCTSSELTLLDSKPVDAVSSNDATGKSLKPGWKPMFAAKIREAMKLEKKLKSNNRSWLTKSRNVRTMTAALMTLNLLL